MRKVDAGADIDTWDEKEEDRIDHLNAAKARGKGAPKKKRSADGESCFVRSVSLVASRGGGVGTGDGICRFRKRRMMEC